MPETIRPVGLLITRQSRGRDILTKGSLVSIQTRLPSLSLSHSEKGVKFLFHSP